jgi:hypothetical protein
MNALPAFLKAKKYKKIKFKFLKTQHLLIKVKVNGVAGNFILDTGASNTCIGFECIEKYSLEAIVFCFYTFRFISRKRSLIPTKNKTCRRHYWCRCVT